MTALYDIRAFRPLTVNPVNGLYIATVHAEPADLAGNLVAGELVRPNRADIRAALPHNWRKAFDRVNGRFWFPEGNGTGAARPRRTLYNTRGKAIATLYAELKIV